jgi:hypothetical protein
VTEVLVHVDHEPDTVEPAPASRLPLRPQILADLARVWADLPEAEAPERLLLHYRAAGVDVELLLPPGSRSGRKAAGTRRRSSSRRPVDLGYIASVRVMIG